MPGCKEMTFPLVQSKIRAVACCSPHVVVIVPPSRMCGVTFSSPISVTALHFSIRMRPAESRASKGNELYRSLSAIGRVCNRFVSWTAASGLPTSTPMESDSPAPQVGMICAPTNPPVPKPTATSTELLCSRFRPSPALNPMPPLYVFEDESTSHPQSPQRADDHTTSCTPNV